MIPQIPSANRIESQTPVPSKISGRSRIPADKRISFRKREIEDDIFPLLMAWKKEVAKVFIPVNRKEHARILIPSFAITYTSSAGSENIFTINPENISEQIVIVIDINDIS